jgi:8-hydroxy-5-deazaflavin:NADPH oxidoreductase
MRDGNIAALDEGQVESLWVTEQLGGRTVVKAWNAIGARSFITKATTAGSPDRLAIPVAADSDTDRALGISLVQDTGFDGFDAGTLAESWRQQPGAPSYCTNLTSSQLAVALAATVATRSPRRGDLAVKVIGELMEDTDADHSEDFFVQLTTADPSAERRGPQEPRTSLTHPSLGAGRRPDKELR